MDFRADAYRVVAAQFVVAIVISSGLLIFSGWRTAWSALVGGSIAALASLYFAAVLYARRGGRNPRQFVRAFYVGEFLKIVITAALFWIAIVWLDVSFLPAFATYAVALLAYWLALLPVFSRFARR
ncbi:ATP synthase I [Sulfurifustis variabilis]|uniref:ATP synthase I n=1 Tax=Sulfurifustis variabilis TaxID=1675686 RepID=A0A1C7AG39_9GAMM|nr:ATP synthase subunit I [Sulfurifustis variabilis]BAU50433.1 ATP synthase I [Sulfurifustis variabilis]